jgi:hypothetical protein
LSIGSGTVWRGAVNGDARDVGEIAAIELIRREQSPSPLPLTRITWSARTR